jgi:hypothetical protein
MWNLTDEELGNIQQRVGNATMETTMSDLLLDPVKEGFAASPVAQAFNFARSGYFDKGEIDAEEANKEYGLEGTPAAFKAGEKVSARRAQFVANDYYDNKAWEAKKQEVQNNYGGISHVTNFVGNLAGAMIDPINLALGFGANMAMRKVGAYSLESIAKTSAGNISREAAKQYVQTSTALGFAENLVVNTATEYSFGKLHEIATNREVTAADRMFGIFAGSVLGAGIQGFSASREVKALIKAEHLKARKLAEQSGDIAEEIVDKTVQHAINAEANNIKPNNDFVQNKVDVELFETRSFQNQYQFKPLDVDSFSTTTFYKQSRVGKDIDGTHSTGFGVGFSDNYNYVHNTFAREGKKIGKSDRVGHYDFSQLNIMDGSKYGLHKNDIKTNFYSQFDSMLSEFEALRIDPRWNTFLRKNIDDIFENSTSPIELRDNLDTFTSQYELDLDMDTMVRNAVAKSGFDGIHSVVNPNTPKAHNMVYVFPESKRRPSQLELSEVTEFNPEMEVNVMNKAKAVELAEMERWKDPTQSKDYLPETDQLYNEVMGTPTDNVDSMMTNKLESEMEILGIKEPFAEAVPTKKTTGEAAEAKPLEAREGMLEAIKTDEDANTMKALTNCLYKNRG